MISRYIVRSLFILSWCSLIAITGCDEDEAVPEMSAHFKASVSNTEAMEAPGDILFRNASKNGLSYHWDFSTAYLKNDPARPTTFNGMSPDSVHFPIPGTYNVTITVSGSDGQKDETYTQTYEFTKKDPVVTFSPESILMDTAVHFTVDFLRFEDKTPSFEWTFEDGDPATSAEENPSVEFQAAGDKLVVLKLNDGEEVFTIETTVSVKSILFPTLYFTDMGTEQIFMTKISGEPDEEVTSTGAFLSSGSLPLTLLVDNGRVYYSNTDKTLGTATFGEIKSFKWDGTDHRTIATGGSGHIVPFAMTINGNDLYFADRREGIFKINKTVENQNMPDLTRWLHHNESEYYTNGIGWGHQNGGLVFYNNEIWWTKCSNGKGLYTIHPDLPRNVDSKVTGDKLLENYPMRSLTIDENTGKVYFFLNKPVGDMSIGMYVANSDGSELTLIEAYEPGTDFDGTGGEAQYIGVTGITILDDYVYWGYRDNGNAVATSGIKRAKLDGTGTEMFLSGYVPYGIVIDTTPR
ncbi:hypothetical protein FNH22_28880 [Fulvivirga sp. M361]|uniref:hypothetical protein n=1 Tax=Fulvivirga sp. M361 TaxID=2594266 RepID=UPI00117AA1E7|nr:hypothetical protein [Fulvivirga sp. M361]TRX48611.1 hypothetical protein FNH22_28880 [Fulvivirga sp. M361]